MFPRKEGTDAHCPDPPQSEILSEPTVQARVMLLGKVVDVGAELKQLGYFHTLFSVMGAISHPAIGRLARTFAVLNKQQSKLVAEFTALSSPDRNHEVYRTVSRQA